MSDLLCPDCSFFQELLQRPSSKYNHWTLKPNIACLEESAQQGCSLCCTIYQSLVYNEGVLLRDTQTPIDIITKDSIIDPDSQETRQEILSIRVQQRGATVTYLPILFNYGVQKQDYEAYRGLFSQLQDPSSAEGLENIVSLTSEWIENCRTTHSQCGYEDTRSKVDCVPTRLIHVGTNGDTQRPRLYLPDQNQGSQSLEYVALSYAWGTESRTLVQTTASNLQTMLEELPYSQLPKTIQDAIVFTRKLGFQYLWVDALCILQSEGLDDMNHKADWSHEANRFGYYYQNAIFTLAATGASSSHDGLFLPRPALAFDPKPAILRRKASSGETRDIWILAKTPSWISEIKKAPLYERGWAIQERILSRRVVHFAANMVLWECHECRATEVDHTGLSFGHGADRMVYEEVSDFMPIFRNLQRKGKGASQTLNEWYSFIEGYTNAKFTFMGDRLPALSGIAGLIQKHVPQRYGAGLWESAIPEGLVWLVEWKPAVNSLHPTDPSITLPSWSWAVSRGSVRFLSTLDTWESRLKVEYWEVKSAGVETSGQVLGARLRVRGEFKMFDVSDLGFNSSINPEFGLLEPESRVDQEGFSRAAFMDAESGTQPGLRTYACMLVGTACIPGSGRTQGVSGCALILESTTRLLEGIEEYRRIGVLCLPLRGWSSKDVVQKTIELA